MNLRVLSLMLIGTAAFADANVIMAGSARAATIEETDLSQGQVFIHGAGFGAFKTPIVLIGGDHAAVTNYSPTDIVATLPSSPAPGTYLVVVHSFISPFAEVSARSR
jgi:hypothetical protein